MDLSGQQRRKLQEALIDAFPITATLERMLSFELDKSLRAIAGEGSLQEIVFKLIQATESQGWVEDLVRAACKSNPGNLKLKAIAQELLTGEISQIPLPNIPQEPNNQQRQKILLLAALPQDLRLDKQIREIEEAIRRATNRDLFEIKVRTAVRPQDIRRAIAEEQPQIVHFCGHGEKDGSLLLEDDGGNNKPVAPSGLASLFKLHADYVKCVLLNACYSQKPAEAISQYIDYVIGMNNPIQDSAAIEFAKGFYDGLGYKVSNSQDVFQRAFDEGMVAIVMENLSKGAIPVLKKKPTGRIQSSERTIDDEYDVFISHASEDKDGFVRLLFEQLRDRGYRVWYDEFSLRMGDSLRRSIDYGLANSRYGIVVISPNFLRKEWPQRELDGLTAREINGSKTILPIWYQVNHDDVLRYSPTLADKVAVRYDTQGMDRIVREIDKVLTASSNPPIVDLSSDRNVDYTKLCNLLKKRQWEHADNETYLVMLQVVGRQKDDWIRGEEISSFPCTDLRTIDQLWVHYSNGHFGFSVQKRIYLDIVDPLNDYVRFDKKAWEKFCGYVGWRVTLHALVRKQTWIEEDKITFNQSAPEGHLPSIGLRVESFSGTQDLLFLMLCGIGVVTLWCSWWVFVVVGWLVFVVVGCPVLYILLRIFEVQREENLDEYKFVFMMNLFSRIE